MCIQFYYVSLSSVKEKPNDKETSNNRYTNIDGNSNRQYIWISIQQRSKVADRDINQRFHWKKSLKKERLSKISQRRRRRRICRCPFEKQRYDENDICMYVHNSTSHRFYSTLKKCLRIESMKINSRRKAGRQAGVLVQNKFTIYCSLLLFSYFHQF